MRAPWSGRKVNETVLTGLVTGAALVLFVAAFALVGGSGSTDQSISAGATPAAADLALASGTENGGEPAAPEAVHGHDGTTDTADAHGHAAGDPSASGPHAHDATGAHDDDNPHDGTHDTSGDPGDHHDDGHHPDTGTSGTHDPTDPGHPHDPAGPPHDPGDAHHPTTPGAPPPDDGHHHPPAPPTGSNPPPDEPSGPVISLDDPRVTSTQRAAAQLVIDRARVGMAAFPTVDAVTAAGYTWIGDGARSGYRHYVNFGYLTDGRVMDPAHIESIVVERQENGAMSLVSAMYILETGSGMADVPDIAGELTTWHDHRNLCWNGGRLAGIAGPDGTCPAGSTLIVTPPMLHVWMVENPCGPFAGIEGSHGSGCGHQH